MVLRLADALDLPLRERNRLLSLAGFAPAYPVGDLHTDDLAPFRQAVDRLLATHEPYPAYVFDRQWTIVGNNDAGRRFLPALDSPVAERLAAWAELIVNLEDVLPAFMDRLSADLARYPDDPVLRDVHDMAIEMFATARRPHRDPSARVLCPQFRIDGQVVRTLSVIASFDAVMDVTLDELRVELIYPEDQAAERFFRERAGSSWHELGDAGQHPRD